MNIKYIHRAATNDLSVTYSRPNQTTIIKLTSGDELKGYFEGNVFGIMNYSYLKDEWTFTTFDKIVHVLKSENVASISLLEDGKLLYHIDEMRKDIFNNLFQSIHVNTRLNHSYLQHAPNEWF